MARNPTTIRLDEERENRLAKLALLFGTQADAMREALDLLWKKVGGRAEALATTVEKVREGAIDEVHNATFESA